MCSGGGALELQQRGKVCTQLVPVINLFVFFLVMRELKVVNYVGELLLRLCHSQESEWVGLVGSGQTTFKWTPRRQGLVSAQIYNASFFVCLFSMDECISEEVWVFKWTNA
jgi:NhaP-type Na+/H+ and K+/H+ antiporter